MTVRPLPPARRPASLGAFREPLRPRGGSTRPHEREGERVVTPSGVYVCGTSTARYEPPILWAVRVTR